MRLIDVDGAQLGVVPIEEAREKAEDQGLDLVEVGADANPPVVRILDWGKLKYEREKKARESKEEDSRHRGQRGQVQTQHRRARL